jgi:hypothetical protein
MKIIYDTEADSYNRLTVVPNNGDPFAVPCFNIQLADGNAVNTIKRLGNQKERKQIIENWKEQEKSK